MFVHGAAGVGKSRLAEEVVARATSAGRATMRVRASVASSTIPLGAIAHLVPTEVLDQRFDPLSVYAGIVASLRVVRAGRGPLVVLVDDAQWLDATSAALLGQLLDGGEIAVVATVRTGEVVPDAVAGLWRRDDVVRVDLTELTYDDVDSLLHLALGGPVDRSAVDRVWAASAGNALFVRELVLGALARGDLVERRSVWWLTGSLATTPRLAEIVGRRVREVTGPARGVLEVLAVWDVVGVHELVLQFGAEALEDVERAGLIEVRTDRRRQSVALAHPLHGEVVREDLPVMTRRRLLLERADWIEAYGARRREDLLLVATARLDAGGGVDTDLLTRAARIARYGHDFAMVDRLTAAILAERPSAEAVLLRAEALHELGEYGAVESLLVDRAGAAAGAVDVEVRLTAMRVRNLMWGLHRADDALEVLRAAQRATTDTAILDELITDEALTLVHSGRPAAAIDSLAAMSEDPLPRARVLRAIAMVPALVATGQSETAAAMAEQAHTEHRALTDQTAIAHPGVHVVHRMDALLDLGRLGEASAIASRGYQRAARGGPPLGRDWFGLGLGKAALLGGQARTAARWLSECVELSATTGFDGPRRLELSYLAMALAWVGELDDARRCLAEQEALAPSAFHAPEQRFGTAWTQAAAGEVSTARRTLLATADAAEATGQRAAAAWLLFDVARLGGADLVAERLTALAPHCEGALVAAYAAGARALAERDGPRLDEATDGFEALTMLLVAAETATAAAEAHRRSGDRRAATAATARAVALAARCEGARTPGLTTTEAVVPLTRREREIGLLAAAGEPSRTIADRLFLSVRTVENHLQNVYTKLGVTNRRELAEALQSGVDAG